MKAMFELQKVRCFTYTMLTRKCIHLTKLKKNVLTVLFLMKELFVIIGIHLGLIKI